MPRLSLPLTAFLLTALAAGAHAETVLAVVAPDSGPFAALGGQVIAGASRLAEERKLKLVTIAETCQPGSGDTISSQIVAAKAAAAIGFLCGESLETGGARLNAADIPAISVSVRSKILFEDAEKENWPIFTLAPRFDDQVEKLATAIVEGWQAAPFALIDDGTLPARELVEAVRLRLEEKGLKPQFVDTFRPGLDNQIALIRRLRKVGVTNVLIGGDRTDTAIIARDAAAENLPLTLLGGEALNAADRPLPLADGVEAVIVPDTPPAARAVIEGFARQGIVAEGYVLPAYAAATIAADALQSGKDAVAALRETTFQTVLGPFAFGKDAPHRNPYELVIWKGTGFVPAEAMR